MNYGITKSLIFASLSGGITSVLILVLATYLHSGSVNVFDNYYQVTQPYMEQVTTAHRTEAEDSQAYGKWEVAQKLAAEKMHLLWCAEFLNALPFALLLGMLLPPIALHFLNHNRER